MITVLKRKNKSFKIKIVLKMKIITCHNKGFTILYPVRHFLRYVMAISVKLEAFEGPLDLLLHLIEVFGNCECYGEEGS